MSRFRISLIIIFLVLVGFQAYSIAVPLSRWVSLRSDSREQVKEIIRSEVDSREGFSTSQEERANIKAVEEEKETEDSGYKQAIAAANKEFVRAKKRRDDQTSQFQAVSTEREEQQKNIKTIRTGIENLDSQIARYNQEIHAQQDALKKWLQTEKQGEALVAVVFTRGFKDKAHTLESLADRASAPLMAQYMGTYIQSFTKVIDSVLSVDFIRAIEEGTAKWNNEEPLRIELEKGAKGTTYLRLKRYELYPFQAPKTGRVKSLSSNRDIKALVVASKKDLDSFLAEGGYSSSNYDLDRAYRLIKETAQTNASAGDGLQEQVKSFHDRINSLQEKIRTARMEKENQSSLLNRKEEQFKKIDQDASEVRSRKEEADRVFKNAQKNLNDVKRVRETIIVKTALATARGSQSPAEVSAEAIIDKLAEVKNDAKTQHSSSTTEVTNFQVTAESSVQAVTDARITSVRLISFINEGDSVRVKMAFRVRTMLQEQAEQEVVREKPRPVTPKTKKRKPARVTPPPVEEEKIARVTPPPVEDERVFKEPEPEPEKTIPTREPLRRNIKAIGSGEVKDILFEIIKVIRSSGDELTVFVDVTNMTEDSSRYVAIYDEAYRWRKSKLAVNADKEYDVKQVIFWKGDQKTTMYDAGNRGVSIDPKTTQTVQLIFKKVPANIKAINKLTIHPFVYFRKLFWSWQEDDLVFQNIRVSR